VIIGSQTITSFVTEPVTPHVLRNTEAMELLSAGVETTLIAMWLGYESAQTTQKYLHAHITLKEATLAKVIPIIKHSDILIDKHDVYLFEFPLALRYAS
jgi:site-specific recombinase XerD